MRYAIALLVLAAPGWADEIQTKDGKKIEFKLLADEGDFWELTTPQGTKVTVKKADFDKLIPGGVKEVPLTGASFTFDKKRKLEVVDLLSKVDIKKDALSGTWKLGGGALTGPGQFGKLQTSITPQSDEYDLTIVAERKDGNNDLCVGLIGGGRQFDFHFDWGDSPWSGFGRVNGASFIGHGLLLPGKVFEKGKAKTITFMVRKEALIVVVDGKDFFTWKADWSKVEVDPYFVVSNKGVFFLAAGGTFSITRMTLTAPKEKQ